MSAAKAGKGAGDVLRRLERACRSFHPLPPLERLILTVLTHGDDTTQARKALKGARQVFVNWNEARVARVAELARAMHGVLDAEDRALRMRDMLNRLFDLRGSLDLLFLQEVKPAEGRRYLLEVEPNMSRPVLSLILFELCPGTTLPLTPEALRVARSYGLVGRSGSKAQVQKALQTDLSPEEASRVVQYLEHLAHGDNDKPARKRKSGTTRTKKKTSKKKT